MTFRKIDLHSEGTYLYESKHQEGDRVHEHHHHIHQILYAIEGRGKIQLDGQSYDVVQDNVAIIVPNSQHSIISDSRLTMLVLAFDETLLDSFIQRDLTRRFYEASTFIRLTPIASSELRQFLRKMLFEQSRENPLRESAIKIQLLEILHVLARSLQLPQLEDMNSLRAERIKNYIETLYYEPLSSKDVASRLGISTRYMNTIFKEQYNQTPMQYLTEVRIETAKKLLTQSDKDIVTVSFEVGYETLSSFYRTFKNIVNLSPNKYRQLHQQFATDHPLDYAKNCVTEDNCD
jgi:AraC-like DNA-binding protein